MTGHKRLTGIRLITFDVYSALMDIENSLLAHTAAVWPHYAEDVRKQLIREWRRLQLEYTLISSLLQQGHVPFRLVTRRALMVAVHRLGMTVTEAEVAVLITAWERLTPWPEAREVLARLRDGPWALGLLSNGDEDMLQAVAQSLGVPFDHVFSAAHVGVYKPHPAIYHLPVRELNLPPEAIVHVAGAARDAMGAKAAGLRCVWINRARDRVLDPALAPDVELATLALLPDVVTDA